jgi:hypothetical protein
MNLDQQRKVSQMHPAAETNDLGARLSKLDSDGAYTGTLSDAVVLSTGQLVVGQADDVGDPKTLSGDATINADGVLTIANGAVTVAKLAAAVSALLPALAIAAVDGTDGTAQVTLQVQDAAGEDLAARARLRVWVAAANFGAPQAIEDITVDDGTLIRTHEAAADQDVLTDATGAAVLTLDNGGAGTLYVMAELDGIVVAQAIVITAA